MAANSPETPTPAGSVSADVHPATSGPLVPASGVETGVDRPGTSQQNQVLQYHHLLGVKQTMVRCACALGLS